MKTETILFVSLWAVFGGFRVIYHFKYRGTIKARTNDNIFIVLILPFVISIIVGVQEFEFRNIYLNYYISLFGLLLFTTGSFVQLFALRILGRHFSNAVELQKAHSLINKGIYKLIRHPIYLGILLQGISTCFLLNVYLPIPFIVWAVSGILSRIRKEDFFLCSNLNGYKEYKETVSALIPNVF